MEPLQETEDTIEAINTALRSIFKKGTWGQLIVLLNLGIFGGVIGIYGTHYQSMLLYLAACITICVNLVLRYFTTNIMGWWQKLDFYLGTAIFAIAFILLWEILNYIKPFNNGHGVWIIFGLGTGLLVASIVIACLVYLKHHSDKAEL